MKLLIYNTKTMGYWIQDGDTEYTVGRATNLKELNVRIQMAKELKAKVFDVTKIKPEIMTKLIRTHYNRRGLVTQIQRYGRALKHADAKEIK